MSTRAKKDRRRNKRAGNLGDIGFRWTARISPLLKTQLATLSPAERELWMGEIEHYGQEMVGEVAAGRILRKTPFHSYGIDLGGGRSVWLQASRDAAGDIVVEAMTSEENFESLRPENLIARIFAMGDGAAGVEGSETNDDTAPRSSSKLETEPAMDTSLDGALRVLDRLRERYEKALSDIDAGLATDDEYPEIPFLCFGETGDEQDRALVAELPLELWYRLLLLGSPCTLEEFLESIENPEEDLGWQILAYHDEYDRVVIELDGSSENDFEPEGFFDTERWTRIAREWQARRGGAL